jgi:hypothetical protein
MNRLNRLNNRLTFNTWERINFVDIIELYKIVSESITQISPQYEVNTYRDIYEFSNFLYKNSYTQSEYTDTVFTSTLYDDYYTKTAQYRF